LVLLRDLEEVLATVVATEATTAALEVSMGVVVVLE
jgi:hypothetical protein